MMFIDNSSNALTIQQIIKMHIDEFSTSSERGLMIKGEKYYKGENDILNRNIIHNENGQSVEDKSIINNKLSHAYMHNLIDDKVNYLLIKPYTIICDDEDYLKNVKNVLGERFHKKLSRLGIETSNKGIAWLHVYIDTSGNFKTMLIPSEQCIPIWNDNAHEELRALIRYYTLEVYDGKTREIVTKIEYWTPETVDYYLIKNGEVIIDVEMYLNADNNYEGHFFVNEEPYSWGFVPFIPFKNNDFELPDLQFVKTLIDNYDLYRSDVANLLEDINNIICVLKRYGGENLSDLMRDLVEMDNDRSIDTIENTMNIKAAKDHYELLKKDIYDFGQGIDKNSNKFFSNTTSNIALRFQHNGLDLKCNAMEDWFKWSFNQLLYFVNLYLEFIHQTVSDKDVYIVFNRNIIMNELQTIKDC